MCHAPPALTTPLCSRAHAYSTRPFPRREHLRALRRARLPARYRCTGAHRTTGRPYPLPRGRLRRPHGGRVHRRRAPRAHTPRVHGIHRTQFALPEALRAAFQRVVAVQIAVQVTVTRPPLAVLRLLRPSLACAVLVDWFRAPTNGIAPTRLTRPRFYHALTVIPLVATSLDLSRRYCPVVAQAQVAPYHCIHSCYPYIMHSTCLFLASK